MKKIMIIDDDPAIQEAFKLILSEETYDLTVHADGTAVVDNHFEIPDLFILDRQLTGVDGIDLCKIIKERPATKNIPVIIISASPSIERIALSAGADEVLEKPFSINDLREAVARCVTK